MEVRKANIHDLMYILGMTLSLREEVFSLTEHDEEALFAEITSHYYNPNSILIVSEDEHLITGFMLGWLSPDKTTDTEIGFAETIYVRKEYRVGDTRKLLIEEFIKEFKEIGVKEINFMAVPKTAKFWEGLGFEIKATIFKKEVV